MTTNPSGFDPFWMFRAPWSGDVAQRIYSALVLAVAYRQLCKLFSIALPEETLRRLEKAIGGLLRIYCPSPDSQFTRSNQCTA